MGPCELLLFKPVEVWLQFLGAWVASGAEEPGHHEALSPGFLEPVKAHSRSASGRASFPSGAPRSRTFPLLLKARLPARPATPGLGTPCPPGQPHRLPRPCRPRTPHRYILDDPLGPDTRIGPPAPFLRLSLVNLQLCSYTWLTGGVSVVLPAWCPRSLCPNNWADIPLPEAVLPPRLSPQAWLNHHLDR